MTCFRVLASVLVFWAASACASAQALVVLEGRVRTPGKHELLEGGRLLDAVQAGGVLPDAYVPGAAWLHAGARTSQRALKLGLLFDVGVIQRAAQLNGLGARAHLAGRLASQIEVMPVTGRKVNTLDPVRLELDENANRRVLDGDRIVFPSRPSVVVVSGAVQADCVLPFMPLRSATAYLGGCARHSEADRDWVYVVQPDGVVRRHGIAPWNEERSEPPAPGARIVVPFGAGRFASADDELLEGGIARFNDDLAAFFATQPIEWSLEARE